jgi:probable HAF family extracellular repeat protein
MTDNGTLHGYSWTEAGGMVDLTPAIASSEALAVNNLGQVVGYFGPDVQTASGYLWSESEGLIDLNTRTPRALRDSGFRILAGLAISDTGSILAASNTGLVLLTPGVPSAAAPSIGPVSGNIVLAVGTPLAVSATFVDADAADTHVGQWTWGDGTSSAASVTESGGTGTVAGNRTYSASGIYKATLTVTDNTGRSAQVAQDIVVYDPAGGYVTGGGWIQSPRGAYRIDTSLSGRATFGFVSKYERGATIPSGHTQFRFVSAKFGFSSTSYEWLVVAGARAQYKGTGILNGVDGYKFILTAIDGDKVGQADRFRIKIFHTDPDTGEDVIDYDNQTTSGTEGTLDEGTLINGGSIVVHKS